MYQHKITKKWHLIYQLLFCLDRNFNIKTSCLTPFQIMSSMVGRALFTFCFLGWSVWEKIFKSHLNLEHGLRSGQLKVKMNCADYRCRVKLLCTYIPNFVRTSVEINKRVKMAISRRQSWQPYLKTDWNNLWMTTLLSFNFFSHIVSKIFLRYK